MATPDIGHYGYDSADESVEQYHADRVVTASLEQILYAEQLRLQLRESYACAPRRRPAPWCIGAD